MLIFLLKSQKQLMGIVNAKEDSISYKLKGSLNIS